MDKERKFIADRYHALLIRNYYKSSLNAQSPPKALYNRLQRIRINNRVFILLVLSLDGLRLYNYSPSQDQSPA
jgi:hypothetical protein